MWKRRRHPLSTGRIAALLAKRPLLSLLLSYLLLLIALGGALGAAHVALAEGPSSIRDWLVFSVVAFSQLVHSPASFETTELPDRAITTLAAVLAALLPPLFFGAVVFKVLHGQSRLVFRNRISLASRRGAYYLFVRFYSSSQLLLVDLKLTAVARIWNREDGSDVLSNYNLRVENPRWPYALTHMPFTMSIPLDPGDVRRRGSWFPTRSRVRLIAVQGHRLLSAEDCIAIIVRADLPQIGRGLVEKHDYRLPEQIDLGEYAHVHPQVEQPSQAWRGWESFDAD